MVPTVPVDPSPSKPPRKHTSVSPLCESMPAVPADAASPDSKCLLSGSFTSDSLNDFITINDRDCGAPRGVARCSGTAELPALVLAHQRPSSRAV